MRTFIAYVSKGNNPGQLKPFLAAIRDLLVEKGIEVYCTTLDESYDASALTKREHLFEHSFPIIDTCDFLIALQLTSIKGEGLLLEAGYCLKAGIPIVVATSAEVRDTYLPELASHTWSWGMDSAELFDQIRQTDFEALLFEWRRP
ncbi:MAG: hypothetical protein AAB669_01335 [Patescibacteria group bacterium]